MTNIETVQRIYAAFGQKDIPSILEQLAEDIVWEYGMIPNGVPWLTPRQGKANVPGFFHALLEHIDFSAFSVQQLLAGEGIVVALVNLEGVVKRTGKSIVETNEPHVWHFNAAGKVQKFRHAADTYAHVRALEA